MSREPNIEQKVAIEHFGGVLLEAGAGSGKTFVLVEHIFFLLDNKYDELKISVAEEFIVDELRYYLASIAMMTFTNKAAGEMSLRLRERSVELQQENADPKHTIFEAALDSLNILTIDGFCSKLVKEGFFPEIPNQFEIVDTFAYRQKIEGLFAKWYEQYSGQTGDILNSLLHQYESIITTFISIFTTPELRVLWESTTTEEMLSVNWDEYLETVLKLLGIKTQLTPCPFDDKYFDKDHDTSNFYKNLNNFVGRSFDYGSFENFQKLLTFLKQEVTPDNRKTPRGDEAKVWKTQVKISREFVLNIGMMIEAYESKGVLLSEWITILKDIFMFMDRHYLDDNYFCFGDLEYFVYQGLNKAEAVELIAENYRYFIVDEFQDTSQVQFDILDKIMNSDLSKLFAVGDKKQAIYAFRGGEISVFNKCSKLMEEQKQQNLFLTHNYRSLGNLIEFNNEIFDTIFKLGDEFKGKDLFAVDVIKQTVPLEEKKSQGEIYKLEVKVVGKEKFSLTNDELNYLESEALLQQAEKILEDNPTEEICFLYKSLTPLNILFPLLLKSKNDFTSQVKIAQKDDPVVIMFSFLIRFMVEYAHESEHGIKERDTSVLLIYPKLIQGVLFYLDSDISIEDISQKLLKLHDYHRLFGLKATVDNFLYSLGVSNSNYAANMTIIYSLISESYNDFKLAYPLLAGGFEDRYSIEFQKGDGGKIIIMTAHASKGLEFDHVFIGGMMTNGYRVADRTLIGKQPGSLKWKFDFNKRELIETPQFFLEKEILRAKDFAESKRLFYVVGTRAVKSLSWVDISSDDGKDVKKQGVKNSWIFGTRTFEDGLVNQIDQPSYVDVLEVIKNSSTVQKNNYPLDRTAEYSGAPLFHLDHLGIEKCSRQSDEENLLILSELSVTSLASLSICPKRFYLKNILKIQPEQVNLIEEQNEDGFTDEYKQSKEDNRSEGEFAVYTSNSAERGTLIHESIYQGSLCNFVCPEEVKSQRDQKAVNWALKLVEAKDPLYSILGEAEVKFDFFGMKISGIPDLVLTSDSEKVIEIWDYKTGQRKESKESTYLSQLQYYCYGLLRLDPERRNYKIIASLLYVDSQEKVDTIFEYDILEQVLFTEFAKMNHLTQENRESCEFCAFKQLCPPLPNL